MTAWSSLVKSKSNTSMFSAMRAAFADFDITIVPFSKYQRSTIYAGEQPHHSTMANILGLVRAAPRPSGLHA